MKLWQGLMVVLLAGLTSACTTAAAPRSSGPLTHATESSPPGDIPDDTVFIAYRHSGLPFELKVPEGWARTDLPTGARFTDKLNTVQVEIGAPAPVTGAEPARPVTRHGGTAVYTHYRADG